MSTGGCSTCSVRCNDRQVQDAQPLLYVHVHIKAGAMKKAGDGWPTHNTRAVAPQCPLCNTTLCCLQSGTQLRQLASSAPGGMLSMEPPEQALFRLPVQSPHKHALHLTFATASVGAAAGSLLVVPAARVLRRRPDMHTAIVAGAAGRTGSLACSRGCGGCHGCCRRHSGGYAGLCL